MSKEIEYDGPYNKESIVREDRSSGFQSESRGQDRQQSKMEDAFAAIHDRLDVLGHVTQTLEDRLLVVTNNYPRPTDDSPKKAKDEGPTGDSEILVRLYRISEGIAHQATRINGIMDRLDI